MYFPALTLQQGYSQDIAVSEKVWLGSTDKTTRFGIPWNFVLRDVLQYDVTLDDATNRMSNGHRTCDVIFGEFSLPNRRFISETAGDVFDRRRQHLRRRSESLRLQRPGTARV
jgi:hypothetical protein